MKKKTISFIMLVMLLVTSVQFPVSVKAGTGTNDASITGTTVYTGSNAVTLEKDATLEYAIQNGSVGSQNYMYISLETAVNLVGYLYYENASDTSVSHSEKFFIEAGATEFTMFLDAFRDGAQASYEKKITKITLQNVDEYAGAVTLKEVIFADKTYDPDAEMKISKGGLTVGTSLGRGGAITYLAREGYTEYVDGNGNMRVGKTVPSNAKKTFTGDANLVNQYDLGREVQNSFYWSVDEENGYTPSGDQLTSGDLNYNPIQAGSSGSKEPQIVDYSYDAANAQIYIKMYGLDWHLENQVDPTYYEIWLSITEDGVLVVKNKITNFTGFTGTDNLEYVRQESPAMYLSYPLNYFYVVSGQGEIYDSNVASLENTSASKKTSLNDGVTGSYTYSLPSDQVANDWVAYVDSDKFGVGIYNPSADYYIASRGNTSIAARNEANYTTHSKFHGGSKISNYLNYVESCYASNYSYINTAINCKMEDYVPLEYSYAICVGTTDEMSSAFSAISDTVTAADVKWTHAEAESTEDIEKLNEVIYDTTYALSSYKESGSAPEKTGYVFAGWCKGSEGSYEVMTEAEKEAASTAVAKFVPKNVLKVKYQIKRDTTSTSESTNLRIITSVDSLKYSNVGFKLTLDGVSAKKDIQSNKVYRTISGYTASDGITCYKPNEQFHSLSKYFMSAVITDVPNGWFGKTFEVTPFWTTLDGTVVTGIKRTLTVTGTLTLTELSNDVANMNLNTVEAVVARYQTLTEDEKAVFQNASELTPYLNWTVIPAGTLQGSTFTGNTNITVNTSGSDDVYGSYGTITHTGGWDAVQYNSTYQLKGLNKKLVVYMYNPNETDVDIAFGYPNDGQPQSIYKNQCYTYATLTAKAWTQVVIDWTDAYDYDMQVVFLQMIASTGASCTAGSGTNLTGIKMSSMYIVDDVNDVDSLVYRELIKDANAVDAAIADLSLTDLENLDETLNAYNALSAEQQKLVTNADKLTAYSNITVVSADTLANDNSCGSAVSFTSGKDNVYGTYGELTHTASWANVYYNDATSLVALNKDMVAYIYNSLAEDKTVSFGYLNSSKQNNIFNGPGYATVTLKAGEWTKVVIPKTTSYADTGMVLNRIRMVVGEKAGDGTNITGFKMSSLYIVDDATTLDDLVANGKNHAAENAVKEIVAAIDGMTLSTLDQVTAVQAKYDALSAEQQKLVTNADKLEVYKNITVVSADTLANDSSCGSAVTFTSGKDDVYGTYGELAHTASWANVYYNDATSLVDLNKDMVVYIYNSLAADKTVSFGYLNSSKQNNIFNGPGYVTATLKAGAWTKVVIPKTTSYEDTGMVLNRIRMVVGEKAGDGTNITGFKMSSLYIVDDAATLDDLVK